MRTKEYNALFKGLAERHKELLHSKEHVSFLRMTLSADPVTQVLDLKEFHEGIKEKIKHKGYFLLLQNYEAGYTDNGGDFTRKRYFGAIIVLRQTDIHNFEEQEEVYDRSEQIGEEIMAAAMNLINNYGGKIGKRISPDDVTNDRVSSVAKQYFGTRFDFEFRLPATSALKYNPDKFN